MEKALAKNTQTIANGSQITAIITDSDGISVDDIRHHHLPYRLTTRECPRALPSFMSPSSSPWSLRGLRPRQSPSQHSPLSAQNINCKYLQEISTMPLNNRTKQVDVFNVF